MSVPTQSLDTTTSIPLVVVHSLGATVPPEIRDEVARLGLAEQFPQVVELTRELFGDFEIEISEDPEIPNCSYVSFEVRMRGTVEDCVQKNSEWIRRLPRCPRSAGHFAWGSKTSHELQRIRQSRRPAGQRHRRSGVPNFREPSLLRSLPCGRNDIDGSGSLFANGPESHQKIRFCLMECGEPSGLKAGEGLHLLRKQRNVADYDLQDAKNIRAQNALAQVQNARVILGLLAACRKEPVRTRFRAKVRDYAAHVLRLPVARS